MGILKKTKKTEIAPNALSVATKKPHAAGDILKRAIVSEKSTANEARSVYTFVVATTATKIDVKNAIRMLYGVPAITVRMLNMEGKNVRFGSGTGRRNTWKKAIITLPAGTTIDVHEGV